MYVDTEQLAQLLQYTSRRRYHSVTYWDIYEAEVSAEDIVE